MRAGWRHPLVGFFLFTLVLAVIQLVRDRSFWLDEAFIADILRTKTPAQLLSELTLPYGQQFPRLYLVLLTVLGQWVGSDTFWLRCIPMLFGLAGMMAWLYSFYEFYERRQKQWIPCLIAAGLLVASSYAHYYAFELKHYSAEFCFTGLLFALFQTKRLTDKNRLVLIVLTFLGSMIFTYAGLFVMAALGLAVVFDKEERLLWRRERKTLIPYGIAGLILFGIMYRVDYRTFETPQSGGRMHSYWVTSFVQGDSLVQKAASLKNLYGHFLTDWWRTEFGPMSEDLVSPSANYVWPFRVMKHPDMRQILFWMSLLVIGRRLFGKRVERDPVYLGALAVCLAAIMAVGKIYPWGCHRLSLYLMPVSALLITESVRLLTEWLARAKLSPKMVNLLWIPLGWLIVRNMVYLSFAFPLAPLPENLRAVTPYLNSGTPYLIVSGASDVMVRTFSGIPSQIKVLYESEKGIQGVKDAIAHQPAYYLWVHYPPTRDEKGNLVGYRSTHKEEDIFVRPRLALGLTRLEPLKR